MLRHSLQSWSNVNLHRCVTDYKLRWLVNGSLYLMVIALEIITRDDAIHWFCAHSILFVLNTIEIIVKTNILHTFNITFQILYYNDLWFLTLCVHLSFSFLLLRWLLCNKMPRHNPCTVCENYMAINPSLILISNHSISRNYIFFTIQMDTNTILFVLGSCLCCQYFLLQYFTGSALTAGDVLVGILSGSKVKTLQGH